MGLTRGFGSLLGLIYVLPGSRGEVRRCGVGGLPMQHQDPSEGSSGPGGAGPEPPWRSRAAGARSRPERGAEGAGGGSSLGAHLSAPRPAGRSPAAGALVAAR